VLQCRLCGGPFVIHRRCFRGHAYCGDPCRHEGRRRTARAARRRYRESLGADGRADHREREQARRSNCRVEDHGSENLTASADLLAPETAEERDGDSGREEDGLGAETVARRLLYAIVSGRTGVQRSAEDGAPPVDEDAFILERLSVRVVLFADGRTAYWLEEWCDVLATVPWRDHELEFRVAPSPDDQGDAK